MSPLHTSHGKPAWTSLGLSHGWGRYANSAKYANFHIWEVKVKVQTDATQSVMCRQTKLQNTQHSSTRVDWFGQHAHFHIWSYSAVWMGDNEAGLFQHSWHFDREWDIHCWDSVVREWCHAGKPKRSRCKVKHSSLCPSSSGYDLNSLNTSAVHYQCDIVWHSHWWYHQARWTEFPTKWQVLCLRVGSKYQNEWEITQPTASVTSSWAAVMKDEDGWIMLT